MARLRMTPPRPLLKRSYVYGVEKLNGYDLWSLFKAAAAGDLVRAKKLLAKDVRLANGQFWYQFPLHMAVRGGHARVVELLLAKGAEPGQSRFSYDSWDKLLRAAQDRGYGQIETLLATALRQRYNYSPEFDSMQRAITSRDARRVARLLRKRPDLAAASDALGNNPLHWSVLTRQRELIARFLAAGTQLDARRADGKTPLQLAAGGCFDYWYRVTRARHHPSIRDTGVLVGELLARGAEYTLSVAAAVGDQERVEALLDKHPQLAGRLDSARVSPLTYAAREGHDHLVRLLLERGADPNLPEDLAPQGRALFEACGANHLETARMLLDHGADPNAGVDSSGCCLTICQYRHGRRSRPIQELLRQHGARTPPYEMSTSELEKAIDEGREIIKDEEFLGRVLEKRNESLLRRFLDADPAAIKGMHVYSGITYPRSGKLVQLLLDRGLDSNLPDWLGRTVLHACAEQGDRSNAARFLDAGSDINARDLEFKGTPLAAAVRKEFKCDPDDQARLAKRQHEMVAFLLRRGAATNLPDDEPWATPLAWSRKRKLPEIELLLRNSGAL